MTITLSKGIEQLSMLDTEQLEYLVELAGMAPDGTAVECGVWRGGSLIAWEGMRRGRGRVFAVDDWSGAQDQDGDKLERACRSNFQQWGVKATILTMQSWNAAFSVALPVAFCFIDADHSLHGIPRDVANWPDHIMPGGILAFHDYDVTNPRVVVKAVVDAWQYDAQWEDLGLVGSTQAYRRPRGNNHETPNR